MADEKVDIVIIGGGLIGLSLYLALATSGYKIKIIEAQPFTETITDILDPRTLALSPASRQILTMINVWDNIAKSICSINTIHISEAQRFGSARLKANKSAALGYVIEMAHLLTAMRKLINPDDMIAPASLVAVDEVQGTIKIQQENKQITLNTDIIVAGDGAQSTIREHLKIPVQVKNYQQQAISATISLARDHDKIAYERFTSTGPMAFLPLTENRAAVIWALPSTTASQILTLNAKEFLTTLQTAFGYRLGKFQNVGRRMGFPISQIITEQKTKDRVVFIGNSAQTLHPIAGQGFNLGLRDAAMLAQCLLKEGLTPSTLKHYQKQRYVDQRNICTGTDALVELFASTNSCISHLRSLGLILFNHLFFAKNLLIRHASGYGGIIPDLVCGIHL